MLTEPTPAARTSRATGASRVALVERPNDSTPGTAPSHSRKRTASRRTSGSPPVTRNFRKPSPEAIRATRRTSS